METVPVQGGRPAQIASGWGGWWASKLFCSPGVLLQLTCRSLYDIWLCWYWPSSRAVNDILWRLFPAKPLTFDNSLFAQRQWCEFSDQWMSLKARLAMKLSTHPGRMFSVEGTGAACWSKSCSWTLDICKYATENHQIASLSHHCVLPQCNRYIFSIYVDHISFFSHHFLRQYINLVIQITMIRQVDTGLRLRLS